MTDVPHLKHSHTHTQPHTDRRPARPVSEDEVDGGHPQITRDGRKRESGLLSGGRGAGSTRAQP